MTVYPNALDDDRTIVRIDDNLSELGTLAIDQLREAVFAIEKTLGLNPEGSKATVEERISVLLAPDGQPNAAALAAVGLVTLPIHDNQIAPNAGIQESKLDLFVDTATLSTQISALSLQMNTLLNLVTSDVTNLGIHISGGQKLLDNVTLARHVASHIDINAVPSDIRDAVYIWTGLLDTSGNLRSAQTVAQALLQINNELVGHEIAVLSAHPATAITVDSSNWLELPQVDQLQEVLDFIDNKEVLSTAVDRATLEANGILRNARANRTDLDGYHYNVLPVTKVQAYLAEPTQTAPRDSITNGDDVISFLPDDNSDYSFDTAFTLVKPGDIVRVNYGNGIEGVYKVSSIRFNPGVEWVIRINGFNKFNCDGAGGNYAYARIDRSKHDTNTHGVLAVAPAVANVFPDGACTSALDGVIIGNPQGATALGLGFDPNKLDSLHYRLWLRLYPDGNPLNGFTDLPYIDVTGNAGATPGAYTLETVVEATNAAFRAAGYNYRFIAFVQDGEFGIMLADYWNNAAFSIISGVSDGTSIIPGTYLYNVVGDAGDGFDALGLGANRAGVASPVNTGFTSSLEAATYPSIVHSPAIGRTYFADGSKNYSLNEKSTDGYWAAVITDVIHDIPNGTITSTYRVSSVLSADEVKPGKTIVVLSTNPADQSIIGYGRFIIGWVSYGLTYTDIMVINASHGSGNAEGDVLPIGSAVRLYFTEDSLGFNIDNLAGVGTFHRYHEIYVNAAEDSFAVERARMEKQSASADMLNTDRSNWRIRNVSSKLKGYRIDDNFRYWVRYYVLAYDATTGEFDGYIGEPSGALGITNTGPVTHGFKNHPVRYYDSSFVNFIDIEFRELSTTPGTAVLTGASPQFIDIEIFPSTVLDQEVMRLAGVSHDEKIARSITDLREFGTTSEENFTTSAISFIQAGERYLHANGVVRGFNYESCNAYNTELIFSGGLALVNGGFVAVDKIGVSLPVIRPSSTGTYSVFICITEGGQLVAVPNNNAEQFWENTGGYFVESLTFRTIVNERKDLTIIARAEVTVAAGVISVLTVTDARRFVWNESISNYSLSIVPENVERSATFHSWEAALNWIDLYGVSEIEIKEIIGSTLVFSPSIYVKMYGGTISATILSLSKIILEGTVIGPPVGTTICWVTIDSVEMYKVWITGTTFTSTASAIRRCNFTIDGVLTADRVSFNQSTINLYGLNGLTLTDRCLVAQSNVNWYVPTTAYTSNDMVNYDKGYALRVSGNSLVSHNRFWCSASTTQRPPIIVNSGSPTNSKIVYNTFIDSGSLGADNTAICFYHASANAYLIDVEISGNECYNSQNIVLAPTDSASYPGWDCWNVKVSNNRCGIIGYLSTATTTGFGLHITENTCQSITTAQAIRNVTYGHFGTPAGGSGVVFIRGNTVNGIIWVGTCGVSSGSNALTVVNNVVNYTVVASLNKWLNSLNMQYGIKNYDYTAAAINFREHFTTFSGNKVYCVDAGTYGDVTKGGIYLTGYGNIHNNIIIVDTTHLEGTPNSFRGISAFAYPGGGGSSDAITTGNMIYRRANYISSYIYYDADVDGIITDNFIEYHTVDGSDYTSAIYASEDTVIIERNKNHQVSVPLYGINVGHYVISDHSTGVYVGVLDDLPNLANIAEYSYPGIYQFTLAAGLSTDFDVRINLSNCVPPGVRIVSCSVPVYGTNIVYWTGTSQITVTARSGTSILHTDTADFTVDVTDTLTVNFSLEPVRNSVLQIRTDVTRDATVGNYEVSIGTITGNDYATVVYRW